VSELGFLWSAGGVRSSGCCVELAEGETALLEENCGAATDCALPSGASAPNTAAAISRVKINALGIALKAGAVCNEQDFF
jgi:hypothetical protein